ncbi:tryptophan halogenase family protein [Shewanella sp. GXUN23E]|uniref:tryptophan halogenase family protein n=1 Tax=Shewanella sp. GXUN23E TaxID=3422498 RepID=UPI003D7DACA5
MEKPFRIAILGGGSAGWLAANHLGKVLQGRTDVTVTLLESPDIPTIGVGEGTVPAIRQSLKSFGIRETDFIRAADVTFKQSIRFNNWLSHGRHGRDNFYHHLFDRPNLLGCDLTPWWLEQRRGHYAASVSVQHAVCEAKKAPKLITEPEYIGTLGYAYHLDARKFAALLAENARVKFKVNHIQAKVLQARLDLDGFIQSLQTDCVGELEFDFYIDCSGLRCQLLGQSLNVPFVDVSDTLLINQALALQVPTAPDSIIPPYTLATAHQAGWIWDIALSSRRGTGFVYSDRHMTEAQACRKFSRYLGVDEDSVEFRKIPMSSGYRKVSWAKNCVALGLAQGFLEPLEATSIMLTDFAAELLAKRLPLHRQQMELLATRYNRVMSHAWTRVVDFVKLHYLLSDRRDSDFWRDNQQLSAVSDELKERLQLWRTSVPLVEDFATRFEAFDLDNYRYVLYGMDYSSELCAMSDVLRLQLQQQAEQTRDWAQQLVTQLPAHRALLDKIKEFGLQLA